MRKTGIVKDERYLRHFMGASHPEGPQRLEVIYEMLNDPDMRGRFKEIPVRRAEREELLPVHSPDYIDMLAATAGKEYTYLDPDTRTSADSYEAALLAAGGLCEAVSMVCEGALDNAFALVRPPGHHAERSRAMGFCLINNVAVAARYAQDHLHMRRILVADWDLHHGNGTQHAFEDDPSILFFSTHQHPYYPGTGALREIGVGKGENFTVNVPLSPGFGDGEYLGIFERILKPVALDFDPDLVLVSAGFDTCLGDPLGGMGVTPMGFAAMTGSILEIADECCGGKTVLTLEGGYHLQGLRDSVKAVLKALAGIAEGEERRPPADPEALDRVVREVSAVHRKRWTGLSGVQA